jgi:hypothetical protein
MNVADFIFRLLQICNLLTLFVLIPLHSPCTASIDCAHFSIDCESTYGDYIDFCWLCPQLWWLGEYSWWPSKYSCWFSWYAWHIIFKSLHPKSRTFVIIVHLQIEKKIVFIARFVICFLSSSIFIYGFCISHPSSSSSVSKFTSWIPPTLWS